MEANAIMLDSPTIVDFQELAKAQPDITTLQAMQTADNSLSFAKVSMPCAQTSSVIRPPAHHAPTYQRHVDTQFFTLYTITPIRISELHNT